MTVNPLIRIGPTILLLVTCGFSKTFWTRNPGLRVKAAPSVANTTALPPLTTAPLSSTVRAILNQGIAAGRGIGQFDNSRCTLVGNPAGNINLRCDEPTHPLAETAIAVDPNDPNHLLVGANNFTLAARGSQIAFFVSFDGGSAWTSGQILANAAGAADPSPAFNAKFGTVHMAHIGVDCSVGCTSLHRRYVRTEEVQLTF